MITFDLHVLIMVGTQLARIHFDYLRLGNGMSEAEAHIVKHMEMYRAAGKHFLSICNLPNGSGNDDL